MPNQHKTPLLGWHPPAELSAWAREEAELRGITLSSLLTEALEAFREACERDTTLAARGKATT